jgi:hypothetical protein
MNGCSIGGLNDMDLLGYAALGGLERLTIVAGALIIGYWGYRLYTADKNAGLIFMGLSVVVLVGALATGGSYLRSVGEGYQLASLTSETSGVEGPAAAGPESPFTGNEAPSEPAALPADQTPPVIESAPVAELPEAPPVPMTEPVTESVSATPQSIADAETLEAESPRRLATGQELGGRIVSVKSENVSLEWSSDSE